MSHLKITVYSFHCCKTKESVIKNIFECYAKFCHYLNFMKKVNRHLKYRNLYTRVAKFYFSGSFFFLESHKFLFHAFIKQFRVCRVLS